MNINLKRFAVVSAVAVALNTQAAITVVSYWRLGENDAGAMNAEAATNTMDKFGGNNLSLSGSVTYSSAVSTAAAQDTGSSLCLQFAGGFGAAPVILTNQDNFGIEAWVNASTTSGNHCLAYNGNTSLNGWGLYQLGGNFGGLFGGVTLISMTAPVTVGAWTHLAMVRDNGTTTMYVNGVPAATNSDAPQLPAGGFGVAAPPMNTGIEQFTGSLDEIRVFTFAPGQFSPADLLVNQAALQASATNWHFALTGSMANARRDESAILLSNGNVFVAGGQTTGSAYEAELYNPASGTWTSTAPMSVPRSGPGVALLNNGQILVASGTTDFLDTLTNAEVYTPSNNTWSYTGPVPTGLYLPSTVLLTNGEVLMAGGENSGFGPTATCELYNPATGLWYTATPLSNGRRYQGAIGLPDGRVMVLGGQGTSYSDLTSVEMYSPATGVWTNAAPMNYAREYPTTTLLPDGRVLVTGGGFSTAEIYDPALNTWTLTGPMSYGPFANAAALTGTGEVLSTGGLDENDDTSYTNATLFNPATDQWTDCAPMNIGRRYHQAIELPNGQALIIGGDSGLDDIGSAELFVAPQGGQPSLSIHRPANGLVQITFTNTPSALFNVLDSPNLSVPLTNWTALGNAIEGPAGQFHWIDAATNTPARFYILRNQ